MKSLLAKFLGISQLNQRIADLESRIAELEKGGVTELSERIDVIDEQISDFTSGLDEFVREDDIEDKIYDYLSNRDYVQSDDVESQIDDKITDMRDEIKDEITDEIKSEVEELNKDTVIELTQSEFYKYFGTEMFDKSVYASLNRKFKSE
jgi:hypothetical protein